MELGAMEPFSIVNMVTAYRQQNVQAAAQVQVLDNAMEQGGSLIGQLLQGMMDAQNGLYASLTGIGGNFDAQV
jgi:hypothetical protein